METLQTCRNWVERDITWYATLKATVPAASERLRQVWLDSIAVGKDITLFQVILPFQVAVLYALP